jgi:FtsP/CotA-like multicopper oxidase with cupredoxin domain
VPTGPQQKNGRFAACAKACLKPSLEVAAVTGHIQQKMIRIGLMADRILRPNRRELIAGLGATVVNPAIPRIAAAQDRRSLTLKAKADILALRPGEPDTPIWSLQDTKASPGLRFKRGDTLQATFGNELPISTLLNWHGIEGVPAAEALATRLPLAPGATENLTIPLRHAGTLLGDFRLLGDGQARPSRALPLIVGENAPVAVDRDEVFLIEDWRLRPDGTAITPSIDPKDTAPIYTINGRTALDIALRTNERLRFRFINGFQRNVIAIKIENHEVRIMALDGQPSEPFLARNGTLVLAPGTRVDAFVDATAPPGSASSILLHDGREPRPIARLMTANDEPPIRDAPLPAAPPLPSNGLPAHLDLKNASRVDLTLGARTLSGSQTDWVAPASFANTAVPAFRVKTGRTVVLALTNRADIPAVFHLHGHHFRLLDRLDDGWKPFWLDTLAIDAGQTQRIAFAAENAGRWLIESVVTDWVAPRLVRWYGVE